jgi:hypothetical protein
MSVPTSTSTIPGNQILDYSSSATTVIPISLIYTIRDDAECGPVACTLRNTGTACSATNLVNAQIATNSEIVINGGSTSVTIKRNAPAGFGPYTVCLRC